MDATLPTNPRRAGALWVAATGAFLLLAAAAVFVAVSWDQLPDGLKLAIIAALTGAFLLGGRALERTLPATGGVLFHLGAFLLPIDVAAIAVRVDLDWRGLLLVEGLLASAAWPMLARLSDSVVLRRAGMLAVPALAAGIAASTAAPAPLVLVAAATAAYVVGKREEATVWAAIAGLAPAMGVAVNAVVSTSGMPGDGVLIELGLAGSLAGLLAVASGSAAAVILGVEARRRHDLSLVGLAGIALLSAAATTWSAADLGSRATLLALPAVFLLVEVAALLAARDAFWRRPTAAITTGVEVVAGLATVVVTGVLLLLAPLVETGVDLFADAPGWSPDPVAGVSLLLLGLAWATASLRRITGRIRLSELPGATLDAVIAAPLGFMALIVGVELGTASTAATAVALAVGVGALSISRRAPGHLVAAGFAVWAPIVAWETPAVALIVGVAGGCALANAAVTRMSVGGAPAGSWALAATGGAAATIGAGFSIDQVGAGAAMAIAVGLVWAVALITDRAPIATGVAARATLAIPMLVAISSGDEARFLPALLVAIVLVADALRLDRPVIAMGAAVAATVAALVGAVDTGMPLHQAGIALCLYAVICSGLAALAPAGWRDPLILAAGMGVTAGTALAATDLPTLFTAMLVVGGLIIAVGIVEDEIAVAHIGGAVASSGVIGHLLHAGVEASEAYLAPVAFQLIVVGWHARTRSAISSWVAYAPAIGLLGGAAVAERAAGGGTGHALVAAAVGAVGVAVGGWQRLAGPLFVGTALLVAITGVDVVASLGQLPAWIWLAVAGSMLLGVGIALERADTSPADAGRRVVEVITERFE